MPSHKHCTCCVVSSGERPGARESGHALLDPYATRGGWLPAPLAYKPTRHLIQYTPVHPSRRMPCPYQTGRTVAALLPPPAQAC